MSWKTENVYYLSLYFFSVFPGTCKAIHKAQKWIGNGSWLKKKKIPVKEWQLISQRNHIFVYVAIGYCIKNYILRNRSITDCSFPFRFDPNCNIAHWYTHFTTSKYLLIVNDFLSSPFSKLITFNIFHIKAFNLFYST